jgi:hypothetical protein
MLKELKTRTSNEEDLEKATFQCDKVLAQLMTTNNHISKNVFNLVATLHKYIHQKIKKTHFQG